MSRPSGSAKSLKLPEHVPSPANIIKEAKEELARLPHDPLRTRSTRRPETPRENTRKLFDRSNAEHRPPSTFSLGSRHFEANSRPTSSNNRQLEPLEHKPRLSIDGDSVPIAPKPPTDPNRLKRPNRLKQSDSIEGIASISRRESFGSMAGLENEEDDSGDVHIPRIGSGKRVDKPSSAGKKPDRDTAPRQGSGSRRTTGAGKSRKEDEILDEMEDNDTYILPLLNSISENRTDEERSIKICGNLHSFLKQRKLLGKACKNRSTILKHLFGWLDVDSPKLALKTAALVLALKVSGSNLTNVFRLIFKISKNDKNDDLFFDRDLLTLFLQSLENCDNPDGLVYGIGSLKFLCNNTNCLKMLANCQVVEILSKILERMVSLGNQENISSVLVQLTACIRNIADVGEVRGSLITTGIINELIKLYKIWTEDKIIIMNTSRIFSKLTLHTEFVRATSFCGEYFPQVLGALEYHRVREDIAVRICFFLGNLAAKEDKNRLAIWNNGKSADILIRVIKLYGEPIMDVEKREDQTKMIDTLVKAIRLIANIAIRAEVGIGLACREDLVLILVQLLTKLQSSTDTDELLINVLATLNNLSYYDDPKSSITKHMLTIVSVIPKFVDYKKVEAMTEAHRVLGNLSRDKTIRDWMVDHRMDEALITLLESEHADVVFSACGGLINLMKDEDKRKRLKDHHGVEKLIDVLRDYGKEDPILASLVCKIFLNYTGKMTRSEEYLGEKNSIDLIEIINNIIDIESNDGDEVIQEYVQRCVEEELIPVAKSLKTRIAKNLSDFEPLPPP